MAKHRNTLRELATKENIQKALEFGEGAIDTLADVSLRLQRAYHELLEKQQEASCPSCAGKKSVVRKKRVNRVH